MQTCCYISKRGLHRRGLGVENARLNFELCLHAAVSMTYYTRRIQVNYADVKKAGPTGADPGGGFERTPLRDKEFFWKQFL